MQNTLSAQSILKRHIALPQDHGSWVFLISPLLIGLFAGRQWSAATVYLVAAAMAAFLIRQPVTVAVKVYSGRRPRRELGAAWFWMGVYGLVGLLGLAGLVAMGYGYTLYLAIPALPVFAWHLLLVSRREERRKIGLEIIGTGLLALAAPAALWVGAGAPVAEGWLLWGLVWLQSAASIVYAYLRLEQRTAPAPVTLAEHLAPARRALLYTTFNLALVVGLALARIVPPLLPLAYGLQWAESVWGALHPATGWKPTRIGVRQLVVSSLFTVLFIAAWVMNGAG